MTTMTAEQFRECLDVLGLTQTGDAGAEAFLGVTERTVRRWAKDRPVPDAVAMLLRLMVARRIRPATARRYLEEA